MELLQLFRSNRAICTSFIVFPQTIGLIGEMRLVYH